MTEDSKPTHDQIQVRAYELYLARNGGPGDELSDWVSAEQELMETANPKDSAPELPATMVPLSVREISTAKSRDRWQKKSRPAV